MVSGACEKWGVALFGIAGFLVFSSVPGLSFSESADSQVQFIAASKTEPRVTDHELAAFARAYLEVTRLRTTYEARMFTAPNAEQAEMLAKELDTKTAQIIQHEGLTVNSYVRIFEAMEADPRVQSKVTKLLIDQP